VAHQITSVEEIQRVVAYAELQLQGH
jgi:hypothetical protein